MPSFKIDIKNEEIYNSEQSVRISEELSVSPASQSVYLELISGKKS